MTRKTFTLFDPALVRPALVDSFRKLDPRIQWRNPVMFVVYVGSLLTTGLWLASLGDPAVAGTEGSGFMLAIALWLYATLEGVGSARALATHPRIAQAAHDAGFGEVRECRPALADVVASIESGA